jgi:serine phosphatase RsbU (regulator of sigma subunit)
MFKPWPIGWGTCKPSPPLIDMQMTAIYTAKSMALGNVAELTEVQAELIKRKVPCHRGQQAIIVELPASQLSKDFFAFFESLSFDVHLAAFAAE